MEVGDTVSPVDTLVGDVLAGGLIAGDRVGR